MVAGRDGGELLTIAEVAELLKVHQSTVRKLVQSNQLPAVRLTPRILRIPRRAVESLLRGQAAEEAGPSPAEEIKQEDPVVAGLRQTRARLLERRGGRLFPDSTGILRRLRE